MCPDARIRGISLGWVDRNSFTLQKIMAKTTSMPVIGDHSVLQNIKLFHCRSMETMSQGPKAVTSSQRRPISVWRWWPAMSRRITPPLAEREIKVRRGTFSWRHTHRSPESQQPFQALLIYHRLKQRMCFFPSRNGKDWWQDSPKGDLEKCSKGQDSPLATCGNGRGGCHKAHWLVEPEYKWGNKQRLKEMGTQRKNWSSLPSLYWGSMSYLSDLLMVSKEHMTQSERLWDLEYVTNSPWATFQLQPMRIMAKK